MPEPTFTRTKITLTVLSEAPIPDGADVTGILRECDTGEYVLAAVGMTSETLNAPRTVRALLDAGSDPSFFQLDDVAIEDADPAKPLMRVYAIGWRHVTPGEGVGGSQWGADHAALMDYVRSIGVLTDPNYETIERVYTFASVGQNEDADQAVTDEIDADLYQSADGWVPNAKTDGADDPIERMVALIDRLDGNGLVVEDEEAVRAALKREAL